MTLPGSVSDPDLAPGQAVGEYIVEAPVGRGSFGTVYRAVHPLIGKRVAIKVLSQAFSANEKEVSRFISEARAANQIGKEHVVEAFSFGQLPDGRQYFVMDLLEGQNLAELLKQKKRLSLGEALPILRAIAQALDAAHAQGIIHRDIKPENIFLEQSPDGGKRIRLLDFGVAKLVSSPSNVTGAATITGTPAYMAPEQARGRRVDHRADVYSFGIVTYRLLTGALPFRGTDTVDLLFKQMYDAPAAPSTVCAAIPKALDALLLAPLAKDPARRPERLTNFMVSMTALAEGSTVPNEGSVETVRLPPVDEQRLRSAPEERPLRPPKQVARWLIPAVGIVIAVIAFLLSRS